MQPDLEAAELIDERPDEHLDTSRLEPYLRERLEGADGPLTVTLADCTGVKSTPQSFSFG